MRPEYEREIVLDLAKCGDGKDYPRYFFSQVSDDIRNLFCEACRMIGVDYRLNRWNSVSIARAPSVASWTRSSGRRPSGITRG